jgi:hypothetical protein
MSVIVDPVKLAFKYEPPMLALLYRRGSSTNRFLHEFPIPESDLSEDAQSIYGRMNKAHPGYLTQIEPM